MRGVLGMFDGGEIPDIRECRAWADANFPSLAYTPLQVIAAAVDRLDTGDGFDQPGIYFLLRDCKICYVGKSSGLHGRLYQHRLQRRPFSSVAVIAGIPNEALGSVENAYVMAWRPQWNIAATTGMMPGTRELTVRLKAMPREFICTHPEH